MSKKYQKLYQEWSSYNSCKYDDFPAWLDQRRDERKAKQRPKVDQEVYKRALLESLKALGHDFTPHPWSEPVPCKGEYLAFIRKTKEWCDGGIFDAEEQEQTTGFSHWMHMPPAPEVE